MHAMIAMGLTFLACEYSVSYFTTCVTPSTSTSPSASGWLSSSLWLVLISQQVTMSPGHSCPPPLLLPGVLHVDVDGGCCLVYHSCPQHDCDVCHCQLWGISLLYLGIRTPVILTFNTAKLQSTPITVHHCSEYNNNCMYSEYLMYYCTP